jgi:hypothetical protein
MTGTRVAIDLSLIDVPRLTRDKPNPLIDDIREWMEDNIFSDCRFDHIESEDIHAPLWPSVLEGSFYLEFDDPKEAMLFKLTWVGK